MITGVQLHRLCPLVGFGQLAVYAVHLPIALAEFNVDRPEREAAYLGQILVESARLTRMVESLKYSPERLLAVFPSRVRSIEDARELVKKGQEAIANRVYALKNGNGEEASGDGWRFRGRGPHQLSGRLNYRVDGERLGVPLEAQPGRAADPDVEFRASALFWQRRGLNALADQHTLAAFRQITVRINGPAALAFNERVACWKQACTVLGLRAPQEA